MTVPDGKTEGSRCNVDEIFWTDNEHTLVPGNARQKKETEDNVIEEGTGRRPLYRRWKMKFRNGYWLYKEGYACFSPRQVYEISREDGMLEMCAPTSFITGRGYFTVTKNGI